MKKTTFYYHAAFRRFLLGCLIWLLLLAPQGLFSQFAGKEEKEETPPFSEQDDTNEGEQNDVEIRVVLMDTGFLSYYHPYVSLSCDGKSYSFDTESKELLEGSLSLESEEGITISSIERACGTPHYSGTLTIYREKEGLVLVNTLPLETYLKSVVPSEMPAEYEPEALMAQAVCARTYAVKQMQEGRMQKFHADVDDSVSCQVYGNLDRNAATDQAVEKTAGRILEQDGEPIEAFYFSTSAGQTSTDEVWGAEVPLPYLKSVPCTFDEKAPWSHWETTLSWEELEAQTMECLDLEEILWEELPARELSSEEETPEKPSSEELMPKERLRGVTQEGENPKLPKLHVKNLEVTKQCQSGAVTELSVTVFLENRIGTGKICGEYKVRTALASSGNPIHRNDGSEIEGGLLLPSAYLELEITEGQQVRILGRGYGHGVGMSQYGANEMAKQGFPWEEILHYFFHDVTI